jgi:hypothetical protein
MKERPILFNAPMVRALLDGTKTQTRRVVKPEGAHHLFQFRGTTAAKGADEPTGEWAWCGSERVVNKHIYCPYGKPGDRLWVREAWTTHAFLDKTPPRELQTISIHYQADGQIKTGKTRPSIHMPRRLSRIMLEVTGVRVERLQDISVSDALAEGVNVHPDHHGKPRTSIYSPVQDYRDLWESINGPESWDANPWVWVVDFKRVEGVEA